MRVYPLKANVLLLAGVIMLVAAALTYQNYQRTQPLTWQACIKIPNARLNLMYPSTCYAPDGRSVTQTLLEEKQKVQPSHENAAWKTYTSKTCGIEMKYPPEWKEVSKCQQTTPNGFDCLQTQDFDGAIGVSSAITPNGIAMAIGCETYSTPISPEDMIKSCVDDNNKYNTKNAICEKVTINGVDFFHQVGSFTTIRNKSQIQINIEPINYDDRYKNTINQILSTFKFLNFDQKTIQTIVNDTHYCKDGTIVESADKCSPSEVVK